MHSNRFHGLRRRYVAMALGASIACALGCGGGARSTGAAATSATPSPVLPNTIVTSLDGKAHGIAEVTQGKVAVIDLWATWCRGCRAVSASVARLASERKGEPDLLVLGIDEGEDADAVKSFLGGELPPHPVYVDPDFVFADALGAREVPTIVVVARDGRIIRVSHKLDADALRIIDAELASGRAKPGGAPAPARDASP